MIETRAHEIAATQRNPARCVCLIMICIRNYEYSAHWLFFTDDSPSKAKCTIHACLMYSANEYVCTI